MGVFAIEILLHQERRNPLKMFSGEPSQAGGLKEFGEAHRRGAGDYLIDPWNVCDLLGLVLAGSGFIARVIAGDSPWGQSFYALSAPLLFFRILFFAQVLPSQGPMIEVCVYTKVVDSSFWVAFVDFVTFGFPVVRKHLEHAVQSLVAFCICASARRKCSRCGTFGGEMFRASAWCGQVCKGSCCKLFHSSC